MILCYITQPSVYSASKAYKQRMSSISVKQKIVFSGQVYTTEFMENSSQIYRDPFSVRKYITIFFYSKVDIHVFRKIYLRRFRVR